MYSTFCVTRVTYVKQGVVTQVTQVTRVTQTRVTRVTRMTAPPGPGGSGAIAKIVQTQKLAFSFALRLLSRAIFYSKMGPARSPGPGGRRRTRPLRSN